MAVEHVARLARVGPHAPTVRSLFLRLAAPLHFLPGQFVSCLLPAGDRVLTRPYSIASDPEVPDEIELVLDLVPGGPGSHYLFSLAPGAAWATMSGNQIGALLTDYLLERWQQAGRLSPRHYIVKTLVTSELARRIATLAPAAE